MFPKRFFRPRGPGNGLDRGPGPLLVMLVTLPLILLTLAVLGWSEVAAAVAVLLPLIALTLLVRLHYIHAVQRCAHEYGVRLRRRGRKGA